MKIIKSLFGALAALIMFVSCDQLGMLGGLQDIQLSTEEIEFLPEGGSETFTIFAASKWKIETSEKWIEVDPSEGEASPEPIEITVNVGENKGAERVAKLEIIVGTFTDTLTVIQAKGAGEGGNEGEGGGGATGEPVAIAAVKDLADSTMVTVSGTVLSTCWRGFIMTDGVDNILVYEGENQSNTPAGYVIDITAKKGVFCGHAELMEVEKITVKDSVEKIVLPEPLGCTNEVLVALEKNVLPTYIQFRGVLKERTRLEIIDTEYESILQYQYVTDELLSMVGDTVLVTGWHLGQFSDKVISTMSTSIELIAEGVNPPAEEVEIKTVTIEEFLEAPVADTPYYRLTGKMKKIETSTYGNFWIEDETAEVYIYGLTATKLEEGGNDKSFASLGLKNGDVVTLVGPRGEFNKIPQIKNAYYEKHIEGEEIPAKEITVADVVNLETGTEVIVKGQIVARYERGFMLSDGKSNVLVFEGTTPSEHPVGSQVVVKAQVGKYANQAQLSSPSAIEAVGTADLVYPSPAVYTGSNIGEMINNVSPTYIQYTGKVKAYANASTGEVSYRLKIDLVNIEGVIQYPGKEISAKLSDFVDKYVTVTGYHIGVRKMTDSETGIEIPLLNTMALNIEEAQSDTPTAPETAGNGTLESPYTPADALKLIAAGAHDKTVDVYVAGIVSAVKDVSTQYGNATYWISADGTENEQFYVYRGKYIKGDAFTEESQIMVGDRLVLMGKLDTYNESPQLATGSMIVSMEPVERPADPEPPTVEKVSLSEAKVLDDGTVTAVEGWVIARYQRGVLISDGKTSLLVYDEENTAKCAVGENLAITAVKTSFAGLPQLKTVSSLEVLGTVQVDSPEPSVYTSANISEMLNVSEPVYIQYSGTLSVSKSYYNVTIGDVAVMGSISYPEAELAEKLASLNGSEVTVTGYFIGVSSGKYVNTMAVSVEKVQSSAPETPDTPSDPAAGAFSMIDKTENLAAGTYYMAGYMTSYVSGDVNKDWTANPYHVCTGISTDLYTATYSYADGVLTKNLDESYEAVDVVLEAVADKANTYYVKFSGGYLYSKEYNNRKLAVSETPVEWVASDSAKGGIYLTTTMDGGSVVIGTAGAATKLIRSYKEDSNLRYGLVFFRKN